jgi:hypothetical protein
MKEVKVKLFADESKSRIDELGNYWNYYSLVIIPEDKEKLFIKKLLDARCIKNYKWCRENDCDCGFHDKNNTEIHFKEISQNHELLVAKNWINLVLENGIQNQGQLYFYVLGINTSFLDKSFWKYCDDKDGAIYRKFFGTAIKILKYYFAEYDKISINAIYHDNSRMEVEENFYQGLIAMLSLDKKFNFETTEILFIDSDHRKSQQDESHFIQFSDMLLGAITNYIHYSSKKKKREELTHILSPLIERIIKNPRNNKSKYNYARKQQIRFFPSRENFYYNVKDLQGNISSIAFDDLFYTDRTCLFAQKYVSPEQTNLNKFL